MPRLPVVPALVAAAVLGVVGSILPARPVEAGAPSTHVYRRVHGNPLRLDAFIPLRSSAQDAPEPVPAVVVVHGGGWRNGHRGWWSAIAQDLAAEGWASFSVDYRLSGTAPFPAAVDDVRAAVNWIHDHSVELGVDPERIALVGGSAGGNLALLATMGPGAVPVSAVVAWSPPTNLATLSGQPGLTAAVVQWLGCSPAACPERAAAASPLHHAASGAPPVLLATGSDEFVPATQSVALHDALAAAGSPSELIVVPGSRHASAYRAEVWARTTAFLDAHLAPSAQITE